MTNFLSRQFLFNKENDQIKVLRAHKSPTPSTCTHQRILALEGGKLEAPGGGAPRPSAGNWQGVGKWGGTWSSAARNRVSARRAYEGPEWPSPPCPPPMLLPASAPMENSPKSEEEACYPGPPHRLRKGSENHSSPSEWRVPLESPPSGAVLSQLLWCQVPMVLVGTRVCSVVIPLGFPSWPRGLERRQVFHPFTYLSLSWAAFGGLINPENCGVGHL